MSGHATEQAPAPAGPPPAPAPAATSAPQPLNLNQTWQEMLKEPPTPAPAAATPDSNPAIVVPAQAATPAPAAESADAPKSASTEPEKPAEAAVEPDAEPHKIEERPAQDEDQVLTRALEAERRAFQLDRLRGKQGQELGDLRRQVSELQQTVVALKERPAAAATGAEADGDDIVSALLDPAKARDVIRQEAERLLVEREAQRQDEDAEFMEAATPRLGLTLFANRFAEDVKDLTEWTKSEDAQAVLKIVNDNRILKLALNQSVAEGDPRAFATVLSEAYKQRRRGQLAARARHDATKADSAKASAPPPKAPPSAIRPPEQITLDKADYKDILEGRVF